MADTQRKITEDNMNKEFIVTTPKEVAVYGPYRDP